MVYTFITIDYPEANGRKPIKGEHSYTFIFPLEDGTSLQIKCGKETLDKFREFLGSMLLDDQAESVNI